MVEIHHSTHPGDPGASSEERKDDNSPQRDDAVAPANLLSLGIGAAMVRDRHLVDPYPELGGLDHQFGLDVEAAGTQAEPLEHGHPKDLIADFHVAQVEIRHEIADRGQEAVGEEVPVVEHPVLPAVEAVAEHHVSPVLQDRTQERRIVARIVFEVGVLDQDDLAARTGEAGTEGGPLATVFLVGDDPDRPGMLRRESLELPGRSVRRAIVDHHQLALEIEGRSTHALDDLADRGGLVEDRNDDREAGPSRAGLYERIAAAYASRV